MILLLKTHRDTCTGDSSFGELLKIDAPNLLQDVGPLQILPKQQAYLPSIEDFLNTDPAPRCPRLSQFLASGLPVNTHALNR